MSFGPLLGLASLGSLVALPAAWLTLSYWRFARYHRYKGMDVPRLPPLPYAIWESLAVVILGWWHLRARWQDPLRVPAGTRTGPPVVCIHGFSQNGTNLWGIRRALHRRGRATRAVSLGGLTRSLDAYVPPLVAALRETIAASPGGTVDVVAHSMGGVVLRMALAASPELGTGIRRIVTLASPHAGTAFGRGLPLGAKTRLLGTRSPLLHGLPALPRNISLTTISTQVDLMVYPERNCHIEGAKRVRLTAMGHNALLTHREAIATVVDALCAPDPLTDPLRALHTAAPAPSPGETPHP